MSSRSIATLTAALTMALLLSATAVGATTELRVERLFSPREAKQFLETVQWDRYEATRINIGTSEAWEKTAIYLDLKGDSWRVEFPNNRFLHPEHSFTLGDIADPRPLRGGLKSAAQELLDRQLVHVYRISFAGPDSPEPAIVLTPYAITGFASDDTIKIKLDYSGLREREEYHHRN